MMCSVEFDDSDTVLAPDWEPVEDGLVPPAGRKGDQSDVDRRLAVLEKQVTASIGKSQSVLAVVKRNWWWIVPAVGILAILAFAWLDQRIEGKIGNRLSALEKDIAWMKGRLGVPTAVRTIHSAAALPPNELSGKLPELRAALAAVREKKLDVDAADLQAIKTNLASVNSTAAEFWPTVFEVISSLSRVLSDLPPYSGPPQRIGRPVTLVGSEIENVAVEIYAAKNSVFRNCWVFFPPNAKLEDVRFENCILIIDASQVPGPTLQRIGHKLLASDLRNVVISST